MSYPPAEPPTSPAGPAATRRPADRRRLTIVLISLGVLALVCGGCAVAAAVIGASTPSAQAPATSTAAAPRTPPAGSVDPTGSIDWASALAAAGIPPKPDAATTAAYIADLKAIDPDIVGKKTDDAIVDRGRNACGAAKNHPGDQAAAIEGVRRRFTSPNHPDGFTGDVPARIWAVVHVRLCPTY